MASSCLLAFRLLACLLLLGAPGAVRSLDNGLGRTPQMGWNSWNHYHCGINQNIMKATADALVSTGLSKLGYKYVNVDDCWANIRDASGHVQPDTTAFPDFPSMVAHVHSLGLRFGLYSDAGNLTCAGRPGSLGYEKQDAGTYAAWGVDYLKYDNCHDDGLDPKVRYPVMTEALNKTGRPIFYSLCEWGIENPATWAPKVGNSWRTTGDIKDSFGRMLLTAYANDQWWKEAGPGGWNDPDMLEVGNGGMSNTEYVTHFSLWCVMKAPLLIGCDVTAMSVDTLSILSNEEMIAVNQDRLGAQAHMVVGGSNLGTSVWAGPLANNDVVVLLLNAGTASASVTADWKDVGVAGGATMLVRDLWAKKSLGPMTGSLTAQVEMHGVRVFRLSPAPAT